MHRQDILLLVVESGTRKLRQCVQLSIWYWNPWNPGLWRKLPILHGYMFGFGIRGIESTKLCFELIYHAYTHTVTKGAGTQKPHGLGCAGRSAALGGMLSRSIAKGRAREQSAHHLWLRCKEFSRRHRFSLSILQDNMLRKGWNNGAGLTGLVLRHGCQIWCGWISGCQDMLWRYEGRADK